MKIKVKGEGVEKGEAEKEGKDERRERKKDNFINEKGKKADSSTGGLLTRLA